MLTKENRLEENYKDIRYAFEMELMDHWCSSSIIDECNDGRDEFIDSEYKVYSQW